MLRGLFEGWHLIVLLGVVLIPIAIIAAGVAIGIRLGRRKNRI